MTKILEKLITTEKTTKAKEGQNIYTFKVKNQASQGSVTNEVEKTYKVEVTNVNLMIIPGKKRRLSKTNRYIRLPKWKKAAVTLKEGQKMEEAKDKK
jgi:large subunit ribosomal protein L23